jgi:myo-inositol-1(or 4)-monophosphatase
VNCSAERRDHLASRLWRGVPGLVATLARIAVMTGPTPNEHRRPPGRGAERARRPAEGPEPTGSEHRRNEERSDRGGEQWGTEPTGSEHRRNEERSDRGGEQWGPEPTGSGHRRNEERSERGGEQWATELTRLLELAIDVAREAGDLARRRRGADIGTVGTKSTATDLVTATDQAVERLIVGRLKASRPDDEILGEEYGASSGTGAVRWVIDPIDGTVNYVYGLPCYAVSIAAEVDGVAVAGVVRNAATGEEWSAVRGGGAWRDGTRLTGSGVAKLGQALVATGFGYDAARRAHQARVLVDVLPRVRDIRRFGAAALDLCAAAEGRVDAYFEKGLGPWDNAAGGLIAEEAGLTVSGLAGRPPGPDMVLAAPPAIYAELHDLLVRLDADGGP